MPKITFEVNDQQINVDSDCLTSTDKQRSFNVPYSVNKGIIMAVELASEQKKIILAEDTSNDGIYSHFGAYMVLCICKSIGMRDSYIENAFEDWTNHEDWTTLKHIEYLYLMYEIAPDTVDWRRFFRQHYYPYGAFVSTLTIGEIKNNAKRYIGCVKFFEQYPIAGIFDESNDQTQGRLLVLEKQRREVNQFFLINPLDPTLCNYLKFQGEPPKDTFWSCETISKSPKYSVGDALVTDMSEFKRRFSEYTHDMFERSPNPDIPDGENFPWKNVAIAGGSTRQMIEEKYKPRSSSDVDIFVYGKTYKECSDAYEAVRRWFTSPNTYFGVRQSVIYVYIMDCPRIFQIILSNFKTPYDVIQRFDTSHIQWIYFDSTVVDNKFKRYELDSGGKVNQRTYNGLNVFCTHYTIQSMRNRTAVMTNYTRTRTDRLIKLLHGGYNLEKNDSLIEERIDMGALLENQNNPMIRDTIRDLQTLWWPSSVVINTFPTDERDDHIKGMIKIHSKCAIATTDQVELDKHVVICGNFDTDYDAMNFSSFQVVSIKFPGTRRNFTVDVKDRNGPIRSMSAFGKVVKCSVVNENIHVAVQFDDAKFNKFIRDTIETDVRRIYTLRPVTKSLFVNGNQIEFVIDSGRIKYQERRGLSYLVDLNGKPLDIYEDVGVDDRVKFIFSLRIKVEGDDANDDRYFEIKVQKIFKDCDASPKQTDQLVELNNEMLKTPAERLDSVAATIAADLDYNEIDLDE